MSKISNTKSQIKSLPSEQDMKRQIMLTSEIVWKHKFTDQEIETWLSNFDGKVFSESYERELALWLLANFVYFNEDEVRHLCKILYRDFIHEMLIAKKNSGPDTEDSIKEILNTSRFYNLGRPGESGSYVLYYFRQENDLPLNNFIYHPDSLSKEITTIVFVDDVALSKGKRGQAVKPIKNAMKKFFQGKKSVFLTFMATKEAIEELEKENIMVISCMVLDDRNKCFSKESYVFHHFKEHRSKCNKLAKEYGKRLKPSHPLGYNNGQFVFGFFYNTPDNSLPIFWSENNGWHPIIKRYDKNYDRENYIELERFV